MSDLTNYFSQQDEIGQLKREVDRLKLKIKYEQIAKSKYKVALDAANGKKEPTRGEKALLLITNLRGSGKPGKLIKEVARRCFLSEHHVTDLWYKKGSAK